MSLNVLQPVNEKLKIYRIYSFVFCLLDIKSFDKLDSAHVRNYEETDPGHGFKLQLNIGGIEKNFSFNRRTVRNDTYDFIYNFFENLTLEEIEKVNALRFGLVPRHIDT